MYYDSICTDLRRQFTTPIYSRSSAVSRSYILKCGITREYTYPFHHIDTYQYSSLANTLVDRSQTLMVATFSRDERLP